MLPAVPLLLFLACLACLRLAKDFHHTDLLLPEPELPDMRSDECHFYGKDEFGLIITIASLANWALDKNWENGKYSLLEILRGKCFL